MTYHLLVQAKQVACLFISNLVTSLAILKNQKLESAWKVRNHIHKTRAWYFPTMLVFRAAESTVTTIPWIKRYWIHIWWQQSRRQTKSHHDSIFLAMILQVSFLFFFFSSGKMLRIPTKPYLTSWHLKEVRAYIPSSSPYHLTDHILINRHNTHKTADPIHVRRNFPRITLSRLYWLWSNLFYVM